MDMRNSLLWSLFAIPFAAFAATNETAVITRDEHNTPYARAIKAGEAKDWERFRYWAEMIPGNERDAKINDWLSYLKRKDNQKNKIDTKTPPKLKATVTPKANKRVGKANKRVKDDDEPYLGPVNYYSVQNGDKLLALCKAFNVCRSQLMQLNELKNDGLHVGQKLLVPVSTRSRCQIRIAAYTLHKGKDGTAKAYMNVNPCRNTVNGIQQKWYHRGNGVFDLLLCSDTPLDDIVGVKVNVNGEERNVFVQFQEGVRTMEVAVK